MTTDFLDRLEADLREAAECRGHPTPRRRRPRPAPVLKALAVAAVLALLVVGGARLANRDTTEHPARPSPTPTPTQVAVFVGGQKVAVATSGDPSSVDVFAARLKGEFTIVTAPGGGPSLADPSLGSVVLYRSGWEHVAVVAAHDAGIEDVREMTAEDEQRVHFDLRGAGIVAVFGTDEQERLLEQSKDCAPAGTLNSGDLSLCVVYRNNGAVSGFLVDGERLPVDRIDMRGHWMWAAASPDGKTILAQWSGECEVPQTFFIDAGGGRPRPITSGPSEAYGWTTGGQAIVSRPANPGCGGGGAPGLYVVTPDREATLLGKTVPQDLRPSIVPRDIGVATVAP